MDQCQVLIRIAPNEGVDSDGIARMERRLRSELLQLDIDSIDKVVAVDEGPPASKGAELLDLGAWLVALSASGGVLTSLIELTRDWIKRNAAASHISISIDGDSVDIGRVDDAERADLVKAFLDAHRHSDG